MYKYIYIIYIYIYIYNKLIEIETNINKYK